MRVSVWRYPCRMGSALLNPDMQGRLRLMRRAQVEKVDREVWQPWVTSVGVLSCEGKTTLGDNHPQSTRGSSFVTLSDNRE